MADTTGTRALATAQAASRLVRHAFLQYPMRSTPCRRPPTLPSRSQSTVA